MAIKRIDGGLGDGASGMSEWTRAKNTDSNFQDPTNAASYLVGQADGHIPLAEDIKALFSAGIINTRNNTPLKVWKGPLSEYDAIAVKDPNTYYIKDPN